MSKDGQAKWGHEPMADTLVEVEASEHDAAQRGVEILTNPSET